MRHSILCFLLLLFSTVLFAQDKKLWDSATYNLHKFEQNIGKEKYTTARNGDSIIYHVDFKFVDRGSPVPLKATIALNSKTEEPLQFVIKGNTSRMSLIDDSISVTGNRAFIRKDSSISNIVLTHKSFPVAGYSPGTAQMLLLRHWKKEGRPVNSHTLPDGNIQISLDGKDTLAFNGKKIILERYRIAGLIWGNEWVWTDRDGNLYCLITNDAEGDKLEMMLEAYEPLLPKLIDKAAVYSMKLFVEQNKGKTNTERTSKNIAVINGNVIDVANQTTIKNATVLITDGKIKKVSAGKLQWPAGTQVIDAKGKTILPALWDMHAHFQQAEWGPAYLAAGITTVRDCGNEFAYINAIKKAIDEGKGVGPNILKAGIIDGKGPYALGIIQADNKEEAIAAVQRYKNSGFEQIKIYSSMKPAVVKAVCDEAHRLHLPVTGHIPEGMTIQAGVDSGMNMVNHITYVTQAMKLDRKTFTIDFKDPRSDSALNFLVDHKTVIDPTVGVYELIFRSFSDSITDIEPNFYKLPKPLQELFVNTGTDPKRAERFKSVLDYMKATVKILYDRGVPVVAGTDMGMPGYSLYRELELYVQGGLTPMQALRTATIIPATVMNKNLTSGSIAEGKDADLIIVDGDPLQSISNIRKVTTVMKGGKIYDPGKLHLMAGFSE